MGDRTTKSQLLSSFADNAALYTSLCNGLEEVTSFFICVARGWDLSLIKSKG